MEYMKEQQAKWCQNIIYLFYNYDITWMSKVLIGWPDSLVGNVSILQWTINN